MAGLTLETFPAALRDPPRQGGIAISGADPEVLLDIRRPEVNLAIWDRGLPGSLAQPLRILAEGAPFSALAEDLPEVAVDRLAAQLPRSAPLDLLLDIRALAVAFAAIAETGGAVRVRLDAIDDDGCHRWHADAVGLRLLCTYRGPGTEWLPLEGGAVLARGLDPDALPCAPARIATGAAALLKGEAHPGNARLGCIHRSPPAGPGARARLLLCIDEPGRIPLA
jgi:hypothetical protein